MDKTNAIVLSHSLLSLAQAAELRASPPSIHGFSSPRRSLHPAASRRERIGSRTARRPCKRKAGGARAVAPVHGGAGRRAAQHQRAHPCVCAAALPHRRHPRHRRPRRRRPRRALPPGDGDQQGDTGGERGFFRGGERRRRRVRRQRRRGRAAGGREGASSCHSHRQAHKEQAQERSVLAS